MAVAAVLRFGSSGVFFGLLPLPDAVCNVLADYIGEASHPRPMVYRQQLLLIFVALLAFMSVASIIEAQVDSFLHHQQLCIISPNCQTAVRSILET